MLMSWAIDGAKPWLVKAVSNTATDWDHAKLTVPETATTLLPLHQIESDSETNWAASTQVVTVSEISWDASCKSVTVPVLFWDACSQRSAVSVWGWEEAIQCRTVSVKQWDEASSERQFRVCNSTSGPLRRHRAQRLETIPPILPLLRHRLTESATPGMSRRIDADGTPKSLHIIRLFNGYALLPSKLEARCDMQSVGFARVALFFQKRLQVSHVSLPQRDI